MNYLNRIETTVRRKRSLIERYEKGKKAEHIFRQLDSSLPELDPERTRLRVFKCDIWARH